MRFRDTPNDLLGHDAAFRVVADLRVSVYRRIEQLVPGRIGDRSSGDVLTRFAVDVDTVSDAYLRVFPPFAIAGVVGTGAVILLAFIDPWVGFALAVGLIIDLTLVPRLVTASVARGQKVLTDRRTRHSDQVLEMLEVLPETWVADTTEPFVERVRAERDALLDAELRVAQGCGVGSVTGSSRRWPHRAGLSCTRSRGCFDWRRRRGPPRRARSHATGRVRPE